MKKSIELNILIESIKVSLLNKSIDSLKKLLNNEEINWDKLEKMTVYHAIRPVVYDAFQQLNVQNDFIQTLKKRTFSQSIYNLAATKEFYRLLHLLQQHGIRVLPYKGLLFISELYQNQQLRESHDLDLLVHPDDAKRALEILLEDGYILSISHNNLTTNEIIDALLATFNFIEVGLDKKSDLGIDIHIDFHWRLYEESYNYKIDFEAFFINTNEKTYNNTTISFPSKETLFLMLLNHHGGRESWVRLKHFCDLIAFFKTYAFSEKELYNLSANAELKHIFEVGIEIYNHQFLEKPTILKYNSVISKIYDYWEIAELWIKLKSRIRFRYIHYLLQDNFSFKKFIRDRYKIYSIPNLIENPRIITFPNKYNLPNFISKVVTFVWRKTIKTFFIAKKE